MLYCFDAHSGGNESNKSNDKKPLKIDYRTADGAASTFVLLFGQTMDAELQKELDGVISRAEAMRVLPPRLREQEPWNPKTIYEWRLKQLDSMMEQIHYIRGKVIVEHREPQIPK